MAALFWAVRSSTSRSGKPVRLAGAESLSLGRSLKLDIGAWFTPTTEGYFNRVNRAQILAAIDEAKGEHAPALDKLKKSELAVRAESLVAGTGWLPEPLRSAEPEALSEAAG